MRVPLPNFMLAKHVEALADVVSHVWQAIHQQPILNIFCYICVTSFREKNLFIQAATE